ncbi:MAG: metallophosphoesterase family protein [Candidatus Sabulitectum sp.]|nr:metallophosphoesterase family protein [Candidatus Sabulitectum sp.]
MLIRVISDVHGNLVALKAVLDDPAGKKADSTICLGDVVGYGSHPGDCINIIRKVCDEVVAGNHDLGAAGMIGVSHFNPDGRKAIEWTREKISQEHIEWINSLPRQTFYHGISFSHASLKEPSSWNYILNSTAAVDAILVAGEYISIYGHTHMPMQWNRFGDCSSKDEGHLPDYSLINCGSVGQPRDGDSRAAYLLLDIEKQTFQHMRVNYDVHAASTAIIEAGLPKNLAKRLFLGK